MNVGVRYGDMGGGAKPFPTLCLHIFSKFVELCGHGKNLLSKGFRFMPCVNTTTIEAKQFMLHAKITV